MYLHPQGTPEVGRIATERGEVHTASVGNGDFLVFRDFAALDGFARQLMAAVDAARPAETLRLIRALRGSLDAMREPLATEGESVLVAPSSDLASQGRLA